MSMLPHQSTEQLLQTHVLPLFALPAGDVVWQGESVLDTERLLYYFCIGDSNYLLVNESHHGVSDSALVDRLSEDAVAPHQQIVCVPPKVGPKTYVSASTISSESDTKLSGDFSVFHISN